MPYSQVCVSRPHTAIKALPTDTYAQSMPCVPLTLVSLNCLHRGNEFVAIKRSSGVCTHHQSLIWNFTFFLLPMQIFVDEVRCIACFGQRFKRLQAQSCSLSWVVCYKTLLQQPELRVRIHTSQAISDGQGTRTSTVTASYCAAVFLVHLMTHLASLDSLNKIWRGKLLTPTMIHWFQSKPPQK